MCVRVKIVGGGHSSFALVCTLCVHLGPAKTHPQGPPGFCPAAGRAANLPELPVQHQRGDRSAPHCRHYTQGRGVCVCVRVPFLTSASCVTRLFIFFLHGSSYIAETKSVHIIKAPPSFFFLPRGSLVMRHISLAFSHCMSRRLKTTPP